jgi:hypothetical protein
LKKTYIALLLLLFNNPLFAQNARDNVLHELRQFNLEDSVVITSSYPDHIEAIPSLKNGTDELGFDLRHNKKRWTKNWSVFTKVEHHGIEGWRAKQKYSLHITTHHADDGSLYYEMHVDQWLQSAGNPPSTFMHFFAEYLPHKLSGGTTNQNTIARGLAKKDAQSFH